MREYYYALLFYAMIGSFGWAVTFAGIVIGYLTFNPLLGFYALLGFLICSVPVFMWLIAAFFALIIFGRDW